jgi:hypothetical protein
MRHERIALIALFLTAACGSSSTEPASVSLSVTRSGSAAGTVTSDPPGIACGATCSASYPAGTTVTLFATPDTGAAFTAWTGGCSGATPTCQLNLAADGAVDAAFDVARHVVSVATAGNGSGTVTSSPAGITCPGTCSATVDYGVTVTLTASPEPGSTFVGWSGACSGTGTCVLAVTDDAAVTAAFALDLSLVVTKAGNGAGTVDSTPPGISCGTSCAATYPPSTSVTLTAAPAVGSTFSGWTGGGCSGTGPCTVLMTAATAVSATFTLNQYTLTVAKAGAGSGTVTSSPAGITCGATCSTPFNHGTTVVLTATPAAGSTFAGWSGGGCGGTGTCSVALTSATQVTATFDTTSLAVSGGWTCSVGVSCQDVYDISFAAGSNVTVAVNAVTGASVLRLAAFAPGTALTGANLLTGPASDRQCVGQNVSDSVTFRAPTSGVYRIAVGRDWGSSAGASGTYTLTVTSSQPIVPGGQTVNDAASGAATTRCGYLYTASTGWTCASGVSCQDVFDFDTLATTAVTVSVTNVTGASVLRMAVFDGTALDTTNRLNGNLADRRCTGQNVSDSATTASLAAGRKRIAVGRDWGQSAGASGTYTVTVTTANVPLAPGGQTANDVASAFAATSCP